MTTLLFLAACAAPPHTRIFWPGPPDTPKLEFLGIYTSQNDFEKTPFERFLNKITGASPPEEFIIPQDVASDAEGRRIFVVDSSLKNVRIFDFKTRTIKLLAREVPFAYPTGVEYGPDNLLYVADPSSSVVHVANAETGKIIRSIGNDILQKPVKMAINPRLGRIYVSDGGAHRICVFTLQGEFLFSFGGDGPSILSGEFYSNQGIAIADDDNLYVADMMNARIQVFDKDGKYLSEFGTRGDRPWQMAMPRSLAFDSDQNLYVVDSQKGSLMIFNKEGEFLTALFANKKSPNPLTLIVPTGICIDSNDQIIIVDAMTRRFTIWQYMNENYLSEHPVTEVDLKKLESIRIKVKEESTPK